MAVKRDMNVVKGIAVLRVSVACGEVYCEDGARLLSPGETYYAVMRGILWYGKAAHAMNLNSDEGFAVVMAMHVVVRVWHGHWYAALWGLRVCFGALMKGTLRLR